jgi:ferredoxin
MNIHVDQDRCIASGQCAAAAPGVFDQRDEDGVVVLLTATPPIEAQADVADAAAACPAQAIHVTQ